jgi:hypothetical protein
LKPQVDLAEEITKRRGHAMNIADDDGWHLRLSLASTVVQSLIPLAIVQTRPQSEKL